MQASLRHYLSIAIACATALVGLIAVTTPRGDPDLRRFDPIEIGTAEADLWRDYYERRYLALAAGLVLFNRSQYGFSIWDSLRSGISAMRAARRFQPSRSRAGATTALAPLIDHFAVIRRATRARFDPAEAARRELEWWQARRENIPVEGYAPLIALATAHLYEIDPVRLAEYARLRAEAMNLRDMRGDMMTEADWRDIADQLTQAYRALHVVVSQVQGRMPSAAPSRLLSTSDRYLGGAALARRSVGVTVIRCISPCRRTTKTRARPI